MFLEIQSMRPYLLMHIVKKQRTTKNKEKQKQQQQQQKNKKTKQK